MSKAIKVLRQKGILILIFAIGLFSFFSPMYSYAAVQGASVNNQKIGKPRDLMAKGISATQIKVTWKSPKGGAQSYKIYMKDGEKYKIVESNYAKTEYVATNLNRNQRYFFRVKAVKNNQQSEYSKVATGKTLK